MSIGIRRVVSLSHLLGSIIAFLKLQSTEVVVLGNEQGNLPLTKATNTYHIIQSQGTTPSQLKSVIKVRDPTAWHATAAAQLSCPLLVCSALGHTMLQPPSYL